MVKSKTPFVCGLPSVVSAKNLIKGLSCLAVLRVYYHSESYSHL